MEEMTNEERSMGKVALYVSLIIILAIVAIICCANKINGSNQGFLGFTEKGQVDYKVFLKDNEFYDKDYLDKNKQYVSSLVKNIEADFKYNLKVNEKINNNYKYKVDATINIKDAETENLIYEHTESLVPEKSYKNNLEEIKVSEKVNIDFAHFNEIATKFITTYKIPSSSVSVLNVNLIVDTDKTEESLVTLAIPLTEQTMAINASTEVTQADKSQIALGTETTSTTGSTVGLVVSLLGLAAVSGLFARYMLRTRTEEQIYRDEVKKILLSYGEYINKAQDYQFNLKDYEIVRVQSFIDLIKIKEDLSRPIFMVENDEKTNTMFAITDNTKYIYMYALNLHQELLASNNDNYIPRHEHEEVDLDSRYETEMTEEDIYDFRKENEDIIRRLERLEELERLEQEIIEGKKEEILQKTFEKRMAEEKLEEETVVEEVIEVTEEVEEKPVSKKRGRKKKNTNPDK